MKNKKNKLWTADLHNKLKEIELKVTDDIVLRQPIGLRQENKVIPTHQYSKVKI